MTKLLAGLFIGVFIGSLTIELISRSNPEFIEKLRKMAEGTGEDAITGRFEWQ